MRSRIIIGSIATVLFAKEFITVNKIQFQYPYVSETKRLNDNLNPQNIQFRKNSYILSFKNLHSITNHFTEPEVNDLVLCQNADGQYVFKIVGATSKTYSPFDNGTSHYVPPGFVFLIDPVRKQIGMESLAVISSKRHFSLGKWTKETNEQTNGETNVKVKNQENETLQQQILQRNNLRQQIQEHIRNVQRNNTQDQESSNK